MSTSHTHPTANWFAACVNHIPMFRAEVELRAMLDALETGIAAATRRAEEWAGAGEPEMRDLVDNEGDYINDLLGASFVVCQRYVTRVVSQVLRLGAGIKAKDGREWSLPSKKTAWLEDYGPRCGSTAFASLLNASANYFKHESEWRADWSSHVSGSAAETIAIISAAGAVAHSTGNCMRLAKALGIADAFGDLTPLERGLDAWALAIHGAANQELQRLALVP